jgi:hypothetical protein
MTGNALVACGADDRKILVRVARRAYQSGDPDAGFPAGGRGLMDVLVITLGRMIACGMAIHAARARDYLRRLSEQGSRARGTIADTGERARRPQMFRDFGDWLRPREAIH